MIIGRTRIAQITLIVTCSAIAAGIRPTSAKDEESSILVKKQSAAVTEGPVLPPPSKPTKDILPPQQPPQQAAKPVAKRPFMQPAEPREPARGQLTGESEPMPVPPGAQANSPTPIAVPAPTTSGPVVHPTPPIDYDTHHKARRMYRSGQIQLVMVTQDPADGCCYEIPLCIPACCTGDPKVSGGRGILGRGVVEYCWACGFTAKVKFRHVIGDVKVEYEVD